MGNSLPCRCPCPCPCSCMVEQQAGDRILVMRADGSVLQLKKGIQAKEVAASHQGYRVVRCDSARSVLWGSAVLESNRLYFLMPEEKARCRETYEMYWLVGVSKGLVPAARSRRTSGPGNSNESAVAGQTVVFGSGLLQLSTLRLGQGSAAGWTPTLRTIPEILSPPPPPPSSSSTSRESCSASSSSMRPTAGMRSLQEQLASSPILFVTYLASPSSLPYQSYC